jgi:hypothetical protein
LANDLARAAAIQQTLNTPGYSEMKLIGDQLAAQFKDDAINEKLDIKEARGAVRMWNQFVRAVHGAANNRIEAETEIPSIV